MSLRIRRGLNSQRSSVVLDTGDIAWATDTKKLYVGDGSTSGGVHVLATSVDETSGLIWDNTTQKIRYTGALGAALANVVEDTSPELGGDLNLNNRTINGTGTINFTGGISASTLSISTGLSANLPLNNRNITGTGNININGSITGTTLSVVTGLGINLPLNNRDINGAGNIDIIGDISARGDITVGSTTVDGSLIGYNRNSAYTLFNSLATNTQFMEMQVSNGTFALPTPVISQDILGGMLLRGWSGSTFKRAVIIGGQADGAVVGGEVPGKFVVYTTDAAGTGINILSFDKNGKLTVPSVSVGDGTAANPSIVFTTDGSVDSGFFHPGDGVVCISTNATERVRVDTGGMRVEGFMKVKNVAGTLPNPPEAGMIVLDGTTFKGYNGTAWVDLN